MFRTQQFSSTLLMGPAGTSWFWASRPMAGKRKHQIDGQRKVVFIKNKPHFFFGGGGGGGARPDWAGPQESCRGRYSMSGQAGTHCTAQAPELGRSSRKLEAQEKVYLDKYDIP